MVEIFLTIGTAYILKRVGVFSRDNSRVLVNYVLYFALPLMSFKAAHGLGFSKEVFYVGLGAWKVILLSLFFSYIAGRLLKLDSRNLRSLIVTSSFGNTAFLGYPYSFSYYGEEGLRFAIIYDNVGSFLAISSIGFLIISGKLSLKSILLFPPFLGLILGFFLRGYQLPAFLERFIDFSVASLLPVILFSLGLSLDFSTLKKDRTLLVIAIVIKMLLSPLIALLVFKIYPLDPIAYKVSLLQSGMPTMITASILLLKYGLNHNLAFASAGIGILLSFVLMPLWFFLLSV